MTNLIFIFLFSLTSFSTFAMRLDHEYGSVFVNVDGLCLKEGYFYSKAETVVVCLNEWSRRRTGRCTDEVEVIPRRALHSIEKVCIKKNPAKNPPNPCLKWGEREVVLPTVYEVVVKPENPKFPRSRRTKRIVVPDCEF